MDGKVKELRDRVEGYGSATYSDEFRADLYEAVVDAYPPPADQPDACPAEFDSDLNAAYRTCPVVGAGHGPVLDAFLELMSRRQEGLPR